MRSVIHSEQIKRNLIKRGLKIREFLTILYTVRQRWLVTLPLSNMPAASVTMGIPYYGGCLIFN